MKYAMGKPAQMKPIGRVVGWKVKQNPHDGGYRKIEIEVEKKPGESVDPKLFKPGDEIYGFSVVD